MSDEPGTARPEEPHPDSPPGRTGARRLLPNWRAALGGVLLLLVLGSGAMVAGYLLVDIPAPNQAAAAQTNVYLYSDGSRLAKKGDVNRENVSLSQVSLPAQRAILAAEDRDFYQESAVDPKAMARAAWNMVRGGAKQSGSTITQQYVKNYYLSQDRTITRKAKEFFIAIKLDREVSKEEILRGYLNTSYFGRNAYGIQAAAQAYYGKSAKDLTTEEGAYLAALVNSPSAYDVTAHPENRDQVTARWKYVLDGMVSEDWLSPAERAGMEFPEPKKASPASGQSGQRGYLMNAVDEYLVEQGIVEEQRLNAGGFRITTTIDREKQGALVDAVDEQLMSQLSEDREVDEYVRAGGTSVDPATGRVVALYGGIDYTEQFINNATRRDYQAASTFKPFVYASALRNDSTTQDGEPIGPYTTYDGTSKREVTSDGQETGWAPQNENDISYGPVSVTEGMDKSINAVFAQMGIDVGPEKIKDTLVRLGIPEKTPELADAQGSIALGTATPSTLDLANAYAALADHGRSIEHTLVDEVTQGGEKIRLPERKSEQAISREAADGTTAVLRSVVEGGTGSQAQSAGRPAAGKTGTAENDRAAWFAGYTPDLATVVSVMGQDSETGAHKSLYGAAGQPKISGGWFPAKIWGQYTEEALSGSAADDFDLRVEDSEPSLRPSTRAPDTPDETRQVPEPPSTPESPDDSSEGATGGTGGQDGGADGGTDGGASDGGTADGGSGGDEGGTADGGTGSPDGGTTDGGTGTSSGAPEDPGEGATGTPGEPPPRFEGFLD